MRVWTLGLAIAVGMVGCVGGPGEPFSSSGAGSNTSSSGFGSSGGGDTTSSSSGSSGGPSSSGATTSGGTTSAIVRATDFSQSCTVASDCVAVYSGDQCAPCQCPNAAIATSQASSYASKSTQAKASCGDTGNISCGAPCPATTTLCAGGKCSIAIGIAADGG